MFNARSISNDQWRQLYGFILACGNALDPNQFAVQILDNIAQICPYDCGSAYLLDRNGKICGQHLRNIEDRWIKIYMAYYSNTDEQRYSMFRENAVRRASDKPMLNTHDWECEQSLEFVPDFIRVRVLKYSCGFGFYDTLGNLRLTIALDRTGGSKFTSGEIQLLQLIVPQLNNLHRNFYFQSSNSKALNQIAQETALTAREAQIAELLCQSVSPAQISCQLHIAQSTTYKHIANIYEKMNISSQRELLSRLLN